MVGAILMELSARGRIERRCASVSRAVDAVAPGRLALILYLFALAVVLAFGFASHFRGEFAMLEADEAEYMGLSADIMNGVWQISPRRTLGFPMLVAAIRSMTDSLMLLQIIVSALFALSTPALFAVVRRIAGRNTVAGIGASLFALWPPTVFYGTSLYSETLALPIFLAALALLPAGSRTAGGGRPRALAALASGAVLGIAAHVRPMYLLFLPILLLVIVVEEAQVRIAVRRFALAIMGFALVVLPWSVYMSDRYDRVIVLTANGGETLAGGLTPKLLEPVGQYIVHSGNRKAWVGPGKWLPIYENGYLSAEEQRRPYTQIDSLLQQRALAWVVAHPADAAWLEGSKLAYMWGIYPITQNGRWQTLFGNVPTMAMLGLTLFFLTVDARTRVRFVRLWALALFVSGVALISWGSWRFRQPADAGLLAFIVCSCWLRYGKRPPAVV